MTLTDKYMTAYVAQEVARAVVQERMRWEHLAFLWPAAMPDEVASWVSANPPNVVPRDEMQRVEWPNVAGKAPAR
jgi:hypothetical protein